MYPAAFRCIITEKGGNAINLYDQIRDFVPWNEQERQDREVLLQWLSSGTEIATRNNPVGHLTTSAWVVSPDRKFVLMAYHNLYDSWAWLGGHADGELELRAVAEREAREESGIREVKPMMDGPISLEILTVNGHEKKGEYVSSHLHLNLTYLFEAEMNQSLAVKPDENSGVAWIPVEEIGVRSTEPWFVKRIYSKLCAKVAGITE